MGEGYSEPRWGQRGADAHDPGDVVHNRLAGPAQPAIFRSRLRSARPRPALAPRALIENTLPLPLPLRGGVEEETPSRPPPSSMREGYSEPRWGQRGADAHDPGDVVHNRLAGPAQPAIFRSRLRLARPRPVHAPGALIEKTLPLPPPASGRGFMHL